MLQSLDKVNDVFEKSSMSFEGREVIWIVP